MKHLYESISAPKLTDTDTITKSWEVLISQVEKYFSYSKKDDKDYPLGYYEFRVNIEKKPWVVDMFDRVWCTLDSLYEPIFGTMYAGHPGIRKNLNNLHAKWTPSTACGHYDPKTGKQYLMHFSAPRYGVCTVRLMIRNKNV